MGKKTQKILEIVNHDPWFGLILAVHNKSKLKGLEHSWITLKYHIAKC